MTKAEQNIATAEGAACAAQTNNINAKTAGIMASVVAVFAAVSIPSHQWVTENSNFAEFSNAEYLSRVLYIPFFWAAVFAAAGAAAFLAGWKLTLYGWSMIDAISAVCLWIAEWCNDRIDDFLGRPEPTPG